MKINVLLFFRAIGIIFLFPIWALELEVETLFIESGWNNALHRLRMFPSKFATRCSFLILGGLSALKLQAAASRCEKTQAKVLMRILKQGSRTAFGKDHGFGKISNYEDYIRMIPVLTYAEHEPYITRQMSGERGVIVAEKPLYYATTSGTTGKPKYIPVTKKAAKRSHKDVSLIWLYYLARRSIGFLNDYILAITGQPSEGKAPDGTPYGAASGQLRAGLPRFMKKIYAVPEEVFQIEDYNARYYCLALFSLKCQISHIASANPSTLVLLFETIQKFQASLIKDIEGGRISGDIKLSPKIRSKLEKDLIPDPRRAKELKDVLVVAGRMDPAFFWPRLASIACWKGGNSPLFLERLRLVVPDVVPVFDLGYLASEIRATVPIERSHHGGVPTLHRNFFEFIRVEDWESGNHSALRLHQLELGKRYYVLITTDSGLYRYHINDIVRVIGRFGDTPELVFEQKGDGVTNLTGEKLYEQHVQKAIADGAMAVGMALRFYMAILNKKMERYEFLVESSGDTEVSPEVAANLLKRIDVGLGECNIEYQAKRESLRLKDPVLHHLKVGAFAAFRERRVLAGVREAQFKIVILSSNIDLLAEFDKVSTIEFPRT